MNIKDLFKVIHGNKRSEIFQYAQAIRVLNPFTLCPKVVGISIRTSKLIISLGKDSAFLSFEQHNFDIKTFFTPCYHIIYFTCSCVNRICEITSGNSPHAINSIRFLTVFKKV